MKPPRCLLLGVFTLGLTAGLAVERLPIEDFTRTPGTSRARLSPDGKMMAYLHDFNGKPTLHFADLDKIKVSRLDLGEADLANGAVKSVVSFSWVGNDRLVITTGVWENLIYGVTATNWDGGHNIPISGSEDNKVSVSGGKLYAREVIHRFYDKDRNVLMLDRHEGGGGSATRPDILKVDTMSGLAKTVLKNPGEVAGWALDFDGVARVGILTHGEQSGAIYRENEKAEWRTVLPLKDRRGGIHPVGFDAATNRVFVTALTEDKRWSVFSMDPANGTLGEPLVVDKEYDIIPEAYSPSIDGVSLTTPIISSKKKTLVGVRYYTELARVKWFDREFAHLQNSIDHEFPDTVNLLVDTSEDEKRLLWLTYSDRDPGAYYLMDLEKKSLKALAPLRGWIKPAKMAQTYAVKYTARDGLLIHGYLTVPVGHEPKNLPLVVMPHGGPWVRDVWGFDPLVQFLANRGYAVLQMNYRGSTGYGDELFKEAKKQIGGKIQDDIEDGTRWALAAGVADPKHIAIMGISYGGYSTLFGLGHNPELYCCGISMAGVTDWPGIYTDSDIAENKLAKKYWREQIGDPGKDMDRLRAISPVNFADKITAPVLIIQGKQDPRVPQDQAKRMIAALEKAGRKPESLFMSNMGHTYGNEKQRLEQYKRIEAFLAANLGPGVQ